MRYLEIRRHTDDSDDRLTPEGVAAAEEVGRSGLHPPYDLFVSSGAGRANEMVQILRAAAGQGDAPVLEATGLRSVVEDRWKEAAKAADSGHVEDIRRVDPDLVEKETMVLGGALRQVVEHLPQGGRALVVGHSPTNEAAVLGLVGSAPDPLGKGEGLLVVEDAGRFTLAQL